MRAPLLSLARRVGFVAILTAGAFEAAKAQLPNASAAAFGMAGNFTAIAKGYEAVAWNAANLAMPGRPGFSLGLGIAGGNAGLDPIDVTALNEFSGLTVDFDTRLAWLEKARLAGGERARMDGGVTWLGASIGPFGLHVGSIAYADVNLSPDAFESFLFGNAGLNGGQPRPLDMAGTSVRSGLFTTGALSFAMPIPLKLTAGLLKNERAAIGITGKHIVSHGLVLTQDIGSTLDDMVRLRFPVIAPDSSYDGITGVGQAADVSFSWSGGPWKVGVLAQNVFNTFTWDTTKLAFLPGTGTFTGSDNQTDFDQQPYSAAPQALRDAVTAHTFKPALAVGVAMRVTSALTLTADMKTQTGGDDAIVIGPRSHFGVGAELRVLPMVPLRAGVASVTDGWQAAIGAGVRVLGYELGAATSIRRRGVATESGLMIGVIGIGR
ncbi:MAG: hypothetical protein ACREOK_12715 [Gemmatimonadaceae bacterium]